MAVATLYPTRTHLALLYLAPLSVIKRLRRSRVPYSPNFLIIALRLLRRPVDCRLPMMNPLFRVLRSDRRYSSKGMATDFIYIQKAIDSEWRTSNPVSGSCALYHMFLRFANIVRYYRPIKRNDIHCIYTRCEASLRSSLGGPRGFSPIFRGLGLAAQTGLNESVVQRVLTSGVGNTMVAY